MGTPVSGPGQFSQRTDKAVSEANRNLPNADYGEQAQYQEQLAGAPMAQSAPGFTDMFGSPASRVIPFDAESMQPETPVTDGAALGAGAGLEALGSTPPDPRLQQARAWIPALEWMASQPGSGDSARNFLRQVKANM